MKAPQLTLPQLIAVILGLLALVTGGYGKGRGT